MAVQELPDYTTTLTESEQKYLAKLEQLLSKQNARELDFYWELGTITAKIYAEAEKFAKEYDFESRKKLGLTGPQRVELVSKKVGINPKTLLDALAVVERWETKERFDQLIRAGTYQNKTLTFAHIKELSRLTDDNIVFTQAKKAIMEGLSARELQLRLKDADSKASRVKKTQGRKPKVPNNLESCIISMRNHLHSVLNKIEKVWFGEYDIVQQLSSLEPEFFRENPKFYDHLAEIVSMLKQLGILASNYGEVLENQLEAISEVFTVDEEDSGNSVSEEEVLEETDEE